MIFLKGILHNLEFLEHFEQLALLTIRGPMLSARFSKMDSIICVTKRASKKFSRECFSSIGALFRSDYHNDSDR